MQKMGTYNAENGDLYQIYFYRYNFIGRKMSSYHKSTNQNKMYIYYLIINKMLKFNSQAIFIIL